MENEPTTVSGERESDSEPPSKEDAAPVSQEEAPEPSGKKTKINKKLQRLNEAYKKKGIVYISRIPPHMKPQKLRHMLSEYGELGRIYLAPEDPSVRKRRKQMGKNSGKNFSEGWVEFEEKGVAKQVAMMLNGNPMGGKRRSAYHYDLWCMKYLPEFKWDHLTEEIAYQKAVREQRLAAEISAAKRERDFYMSRVDKAKAISAQQERKRKRQQKEDGNVRNKPDGQEASAAPDDGKQNKLLRTYGQKRAKADPVSAEAAMMNPDVLALIAGKKQG